MNPSEKVRTRRSWNFARRFAAASEGIAAVEFAVIAPVMIVLFFGVTELSDALGASTKVGSVASTAADLIAQEKVVCNAEMTDAFAAVDSIMYPYPVNSMQVRVSSVVEDVNGQMRVAWSDGKNISALAVNTIVTLPTGLVTAVGASVIMAEVWYNYSSNTGKYIYGTLPLSNQFYSRPRRVTAITRTATTC